VRTDILDRAITLADGERSYRGGCVVAQVASMVDEEKGTGLRQRLNALDGASYPGIRVRVAERAELNEALGLPRASQLLVELQSEWDTITVDPVARRGAMRRVVERAALGQATHYFEPGPGVTLCVSCGRAADTVPMYGEPATDQCGNCGDRLP
jgi:hypothetical protein